MSKARYYKTDGKKGRARDLPASLFDGVVNEAVLHRVVKAHLANQRQGTAAAKNRAAVKGGSRKPWRQKGTGRARQGTTRAPQWVGGGRAFPPQPHSWREGVPKKVKALAKTSAFTARAEADRVVVIDPLGFDKPATRRLVKYLEAIGAEGKVLLLTDGNQPQVVLSARNVSGILVRPFGEESTYDILWAHTVVIERGALDRLASEPAASTAVKTEDEVEASGSDQAQGGPDEVAGEADQASAQSDQAEAEAESDA